MPSSGFRRGAKPTTAMHESCNPASCEQAHGLIACSQPRAVPVWLKLLRLARVGRTRLNAGPPGRDEQRSPPSSSRMALVHRIQPPQTIDRQFRSPIAIEFGRPHRIERGVNTPRRERAAIPPDYTRMVSLQHVQHLGKSQEASRMLLMELETAGVPSSPTTLATQEARAISSASSKKPGSQ